MNNEPVRCSKCGEIATPDFREKYKGQGFYLCFNCGYEFGMWEPEQVNVPPTIAE
jgi:DNA-directed RNA polymerase subunit N (RpoN/RPB10)